MPLNHESKTVNNEKSHWSIKMKFLCSRVVLFRRKSSLSNLYFNEMAALATNQFGPPLEKMESRNP
jgi:hypothetical protein